MSNKIDSSRHAIIEYDRLETWGFLVILIISLLLGALINGVRIDIANIRVVNLSWEHIVIEGAISVLIYGSMLFSKFQYLKRRFRVYTPLFDETLKMIDEIKVKIKTSSNEALLQDQLNNFTTSLKNIREYNGLPLKFNPDNDAINKLFQVSNLIVITEAELYKWLDLTYVFYLINNAILNIRWINNKTKYSLAIARDKNEDKNNEGYGAYKCYLNQKVGILKTIAAIDMNNLQSIDGFISKLNRTIRFVFLTDDDLVVNRSTLEYLYATHELFGCFLFLINKDAYKVQFKLQKKELVDDQDMRGLIVSTGYDVVANGGRIDIGFGLNSTRYALDVFQRTKSNLESIEAQTEVKVHLVKYIKKLALFLLDGERYRDERTLYDNLFINNKLDQVTPNNNNYFIYSKNK